MMNKSKIEKQMPEPQPNSEQKADGLPSSPAIAKPIVIGSQSPPMSLDVAISELSVKENYVNINDWLDYIMSCLQNVDGFYEWFDKKYKNSDFSIVAKVGGGFYVDLSQLRKLFTEFKKIKKEELSDIFALAKKISLSSPITGR